MEVNDKSAKNSRISILLDDNQRRIFDEEKTHLAWTIKQIESWSGGEITGNYTNKDGTATPLFGFAHRSKKDILAEPYYGRMDVRSDGENETHYIGKIGIQNSNYEQIVVDWRSKFGKLFRNKTESNFTITVKNQTTNYNLLLRRAFLIQNGNLENFKDEYIDSEYSMEQRQGKRLTKTEKALGKISDPFLAELIRLKRKQNRLTDIIVSIQQNQNNIILQPLKQNLIVQGCAGSGKTMVLLHRLSQIAYDNPELNFATFRILTPNHTFAHHIRELSSELDISTIQSSTFEEYLADMIGSYVITEYKLLNKNYSNKTMQEYKKNLLAVSKETVCDYGLPNYAFEEIQLFLDDYIESFKKQIMYNKIIDILTKVSSNTQNLLLSSTSFVDLVHLLLTQIDMVNAKLANDTPLVKTISELKQKLADLDKKLKNSKSNKIENANEEYASNLNKKEFYNNQLQKAETDLVAFTDNWIIPTNELVLLKKAYKLLRNMRISTVVAKIIKDIYGKNNVSLREYLTIALYIHMQCHKKCAPLPTSLICIDEGQELSAIEYTLLRQVNANNVCFNIYGDLNQRTRACGISNWNELALRLNAKQYQLSENYRNSLEINDFCNKKLNYNFLGIGISCGNVSEINKANLISLIKSLVIENARYAIICKNKEEPVIQNIISQNKDKVVFSKIEPGKISVLSPTEAKGLEFEGCFVIPEDMNKNELYISYTRALNELYIVNT